MKTQMFVAASALLALPASLFAGTVHFNPPSAIITPGTANVQFEVSVSWNQLTTIDTVNVVTESTVEDELDFSYATSFIDSTTIPPPDPGWYCDPGPCFGPAMISFGGNRFAPVGWSSPLLIGTLTIPTSSLAAGEQVEVKVVTEADLFFTGVSLVASGVNQEALSGSATITVVPEPSMLVAWLAACAAAAKRRMEKCHEA